MSRVRVCFLGTPEFAVTSLKGLLKDDHFEVVGVVTQPDRPAGRKLQLTPSPVKVLAQSLGIRVLSPESLRDNQMMMDAIRTWGAEVAVVVAFGQILSEDFLKIFNFGAVNVHASVLPRWRGAAPIQRAIEFGDRESGVTLQKVVKKLDAGDILGIRRFEINDEITALELHDELALLGADLLHVELMDYVRGNLVGVAQDESQVTYAKKIDKSESEIHWNKTALQIHNKVRAMTMGPGTFTVCKGKKLKIHKTKVESTSGQGLVGKILKVTGEHFFVQCSEGVLKVLEVQPESKPRMSVSDFLKGNTLSEGEILEPISKIGSN